MDVIGWTDVSLLGVSALLITVFYLGFNLTQFMRPTT